MKNSTKHKKERERERKKFATILSAFSVVWRYAFGHVAYLAEQFIREIGETHKKVPAAKNYYVFVCIPSVRACVRAHAPLRHSTIDNAHRPHNRSLLFVALALKFNSIPCVCVLRVTKQCVQCTHTITPNATISTRWIKGNNKVNVLRFPYRLSRIIDKPVF